MSLWDEHARARGFAGVIAAEHGLPSVLIQHVPGNAGHAGDAHVHILIIPRALTRDGFGAVADELNADERGEILAAMWTRLLARGHDLRWQRWQRWPVATSSPTAETSPVPGYRRVQSQSWN